MMKPLLAFILVVASLVPGIRPLSNVALAQTTGPGGTPQLQASVESLRYTQAAPSAILTYAAIVLEGVNDFPDDPSPEQVKDSDLRKQLLALRLMMDVNAFAYEPRPFKAYRDVADAAYESMGTYQDLFVTSQLDGAPIDPDQQAARLTRMQEALAPFRLASFRDDLKAFFAQPAPRPIELDANDRPHLWQLAGTVPSDDFDSAGNAALLGQGVLKSLSDEALLVDDILDPTQEARFHDVRKALRSVVDLADLYPSLTTATHGVQKPLDDLVDAYGDVNDESVAYHTAQESGRDVDARAAALREAYAKARSTATQLVDRGQLEAYVAKLAPAQASHRATPGIVPAVVPAPDRPTLAGGHATVSALQFASHVTDKSEPIDPRIDFPQDNHGVWVTFDYANLPAGSRLTRIVRFDGDDFNWDGDQYGHLECCPSGGSGRFSFRVERLDGDTGWLPGGAYDVRIYLDGSEVAHGGFGIKGTRGSGTEIPGGHNHAHD